MSVGANVSRRKGLKTASTVLGTPVRRMSTNIFAQCSDCATPMAIRLEGISFRKSKVCGQQVERNEKSQSSSSLPTIYRRQ
jgi:hypothetical protein